MKVLYTGVNDGTCLQRARALGSLGHEVHHVISGPPTSFAARQIHRIGHRLGRTPDLHDANRLVRDALARDPFDLLWVDRGLEIRPSTLHQAKKLRPDLRLVHFSPDDMLNPGNQSAYYLRAIPLYDLHVTTKSCHPRELRELGARNVVFVDNAYDPDMHRPLELTVEEQARFRCGVGFVGTFERERAETIARLAGEGLQVTVRGDGWMRPRSTQSGLRFEPGHLEGLAYAKSINATAINLGFLRRVNRDVQTTRSVEIPACGAFMLAERTDEHRRLFEEGREAEFFGSFEELVAKCHYYLEHDDERRLIAAAGLRRCREGGYSYAERLRGVLASLGRSGAREPSVAGARGVR